MIDFRSWTIDLNGVSKKLQEALWFNPTTRKMKESQAIAEDSPTQPDYLGLNIWCDDVLGNAK